MICGCRISRVVRDCWWRFFLGDLFRGLSLYVAVSQDFFEIEGVVMASPGYDRFEDALFETVHL